MMPETGRDRRLSQLAGCGKSAPWPLSTMANPEKADFSGFAAATSSGG
jgi:hypothetical protein